MPESFTPTFPEFCKGVLPLIMEFSREANYPRPVDEESILSLVWARQGTDSLYVKAHSNKEGKITNFILATADPSPLNNSVTLAHELFWFCAKEERGGSGSVRLAKEFLAWCKERGHVAVMSEINGVSPEGVGELYEKLGLKLMERSYALWPQ